MTSTTIAELEYDKGSVNTKEATKEDLEFIEGFIQGQLFRRQMLYFGNISAAYMLLYNDLRRLEMCGLTKNQRPYSK